MHKTEGSQAIPAPETPGGLNPDIHYQPLKDAIPDWLGNASAARRAALKQTQPSLPLKLQGESVAARHALNALHADHWTAQNDVDKQLALFKEASAFAEPLLKAEIKRRFDLDIDVRATFLRLYIPATTPLFSVKTGARTWTVSLLDAALHNFEEKECEDDAYETASTFITQPSKTGQFDTLPAVKEKLGIPAFARLCRELDIGAKYMTYLEDDLGISSADKASALRKQVDSSQQAALKAALQLARMTGDISEGYYRTITGLADGLPHLRIHQQALLVHSLTMMAAPLAGILVFAPPADEVRKVARVVAWVPDDPEHPIKEYASSAELEVELTRQLRSSEYQTFFSRFIDHDQRGFFFSSLNARLSRVKWHETVAGSQEPAWRDEPLSRPDLQLAATPINAELWEHLYQARLNKILNDARVIAVASATVDSKVRWALWDSFVSIASAIVQTAAFIIAPFVPVMGEMMMAYMAYQFLDEVFEGIVDWAQGQTSLAIQHLIGTVDALIQLGIFAAGGTLAVGEFRKVLPKETVAFIERFMPVRMADGQTRYWEPDLARYRHKTVPAENARPSRLGLYDHDGKRVLPLDREHYAVSEDPLRGHYRIEHPSRPDAYRPIVRHNGDGAWHSELEQPLTWDNDTALRRIGHTMEPFSPARRERILQISGYNEAALRKMHVELESTPPLLADSITRFKIDQDLQVFIEQLASEQPERYRQADPLTQLQLLAEHGRWPAEKRLRFVDVQGEVVWQSSTDESLPLTDIHQDGLVEQDVLKTLLKGLDEQAAKALLGETFGDPDLPLDVRTGNLRQQMLQLAKDQRNALFTSRYQAGEQAEGPLLQQLAQHQPSLPTRVAQELLDTATGTELRQISDGKLPQRQQELMHMASEEVRVTRAFEGLELDSVSNPDTDTLVLHSLKNVPGWSGEVRLEIRDRTFEGKRLDSTGGAEAPEQKILVRQSDGRYQPFDEHGQELHPPTDLYSSILYALPDAERRAINLQIGQGEQLQSMIRAQPLKRGELRVAISLAPVRHPAVDTLRLVGVEGYDRLTITNNPAGPLTFTLEDRVREIYPEFMPDQIQTLITRLQDSPAGVRGELSRLSNEFDGLAQELHSWAADIPATDPATGQPLTALERQIAMRSRQIFKNSLQLCWRRQLIGPTGYRLRLTEPVMGDLPTINADFSHVAALAINGSTNMHGIEAFVELFPGLMTLDLQHFDMPNLPPALNAMPALRQLVARNCGITLTPANQQLLASLPELSLLDLQDNPLGGTPDIHRMRGLRYLNLANTGLTEPPANLLDHFSLTTCRLSGNNIGEIPPELFNLAGTLSDGFEFANNPLSDISRERVKAHFARTGRHFGVLPDPMDVTRAFTLFTEINPEGAIDVVYNLPGTLADGRAQLLRWEAEIARLQDDLAQWSRNVPEQDPSTGLALDANERANQRILRDDFRKALERFWRDRERNMPSRRNNHFAATAGFIGDMPVITADFSYVDRLTLNGNKNVTATTAFVAHFPNLSSLELRTFALHPVSEAIPVVPGLQTLVLDDCGVIMTPENEAALGSMNLLETLELNDNPLGTAPDLTALARLTYLDLSNSGIIEVPDSLINHPSLRTVILSGNHIKQIPEALFDLPGTFGDNFDFADNPLSPTTRERVKTYYRATGLDFDIRADAADIALMQELFPTLDIQEASDAIYDLPGTLENGTRQIASWKAEFTQMSTELRQWALAVPERHPITNVPLTAEQMYAEHVARAEFKQNLEQFWSSRPEPSRMRSDHLRINLNFSGDVPHLSANFEHVVDLKLSGNAAIRSSGNFLALFPNLTDLNMRNFALSEVPDAISALRGLKNLSLVNCGITLTPQSQAVISSLSQLETLELSANTLTTTPDLSALLQLNELHLSNTGITELPADLFNMPNLRRANFADNQIEKLPSAVFNLDIDLADRLYLTNNPLSPISQERIKSFFVEKGADFGVLADSADIQRTQALFPALDEEDASRVIYKLPGTLADGKAQLSAWEADFARLNTELLAWSDDIPQTHPLNATPLSAPEIAAERRLRGEFCVQLKNYWRQRLTSKPELRLDAYQFELSFFGDLPVLTVDFGHVSILALKGNNALNIPGGFLQRFTGLQHLEARKFNLGRIPEAVSHMPSIRKLVLSQCAIVLDTAGHAILNALPRLEMLDLYDNPLGQAPDLARLPSLSFIDLSRTGLEQVPPGVLNHPKLDTAILNNNHIGEFPNGIFELPAGISEGFDLGENPLLPDTKERIKTYFQQTEIDLGVLADANDIELTRTLYPDLSVAQASAVVYRLPGTLAEGRAELTHRQSELATLLSDLDEWMTNVPVAPETGEPLSPAMLLQEQQRRQQLGKDLEQCWRQRPLRSQSESGFSFDRPIIGDLPTLRADFGHVRTLHLTSPKGIAPRIGRFLERFSNLTSLAIQNYRLDNIPEAVLRMRQLTTLSLPDCQITMTKPTVEALARLENLDHLNLRDNPLGLTPDLTSIQGLSSLDLSHTGIVKVPDGLLRNTQIRHADLSSNAITDLPTELVDADAVEFNFTGNLLTDDGQRTLTAYLAKRTERVAQRIEPEPVEPEDESPSSRSEEVPIAMDTSDETP